MPNVFLSYSREDLPLIKELEADLHKRSGISIWRDQEKLYGGQKWPRILGEAIGDQDFFLLAWSKSSAASHFVEFEWCTALALKKPVIPCLLDSTKLPPSLAATHAIPVENIQEILAALTGSIPARDTTRRAEVINKLDQIPDTKPEDVLVHVKTTFEQKHWVVHGNVIQGEHVAVTITGGSKEHKGLLDKWQTWAGLVVTLLTVVSLIADLPGKLNAVFQDKPAIKSEADEESQKLEQLLEGSIRDEAGQPVEGVKVSLPKFNQIVTTDPLGQFRFRVTDLKQETVGLLAQKDGFEPYENDFTLGNTEISFTLKEKP